MFLAHIKYYHELMTLVYDIPICKSTIAHSRRYVVQSKLLSEVVLTLPKKVYEETTALIMPDQNRTPKNHGKQAHFTVYDITKWFGYSSAYKAYQS